MIYAREISPEYRQSPLFFSDEFPDNIAVCGNKDYKEHCPKVFHDVWTVLTNGELSSMIEDKKELKQFFDNVTDAILSYLPPVHKKRYSTKEISILKEWILRFDASTKKDEDDIFCAVLSIVTGKEWNYKQISGCCQSEWNYVYYPSNEWDDESLSTFEVQYFNTGSEWSVEEIDGDGDVPNPEDVVGVNIYCVSWRDNGIRKEIADYFGAKPEEVALYKFAGYISTPTYELVN